MPMMFSTLESAVVWLVTNGWKQTSEGEWFKGKREADINRSPAGDGVVSVVTRRLSPARALRI